MPSSSSFFRRSTRLFSALLFVTLLILPMAEEYFAFVPKTAVAEKDKDKLPVYDGTLASAKARFDSLRGGYPERHFGFRGLLIKWNYFLDAYVLSSSFSGSPVVVGKKGWFFRSQDGPDHNILEGRQTSPPLPEERMRWIMDDLVARRDWLAGHGIKYLVVVVPNKNTVYPEMLPRGFEKTPEDSPLDQLLRYIREHSNLDVVDLRPALFAEKQKHQIFYATDSHWNPRGGYAAYVAIMHALKRFFPDMEPIARDKFAEISYPMLPGDLAFMMGLENQLSEPRLLFVTSKKARGTASDARPDHHYFQPPQASEIKGSTLPRALFFHDSFFWELLPFLAEHFSRADYIWLKPQHGNETRFFNKELILQEKPDIVVDEFTERYFIPSMNPSADAGQYDE